MTRLLWALVIIAGIILAGLKTYDWIERAEADRFEQRDQMVRKLAEDRAAEAARVLESGSAARASAITGQFEAAQQGRNLDSLLSGDAGGR
jgi:hypothetical protein